MVVAVGRESPPPLKTSANARFWGVGGVVTPEIEHEHLISRVLGVVYSGGNGAGLEKAHNLQKQAQILNFGACRIIDREWRPKKARNP